MDSPQSLPGRKRHTKPCKYFHAGTCPLSSDVCDFSHVQAQYSAAYAPCKYFTTGHCDAVGPCPYPHPGNEGMYGYPRKQEYVPSIVPYPLQVGAYPAPISPTLYSPYGDATSPTSIFPPHHLYKRPSEASTIESPTTSSSGSLDEPIQMDEASYSKSLAIPPSFTNPFHGSSSMSSMSAPMEARASTPSPKMTRNRSRSTGPSKRKLAKYKTKKCKFWTPENGCPNGPTCTFIHGDESGGVLPRPDPKHGVPDKPLSVQELNAQKGYYPVNWRVIGGGVRMGVDHEASYDQERAHSPDLYEDDMTSSSAPSSIPSGYQRRRSNSNPDEPNLVYSQAKAFLAET